MADLVRASILENKETLERWAEEGRRGMVYTKIGAEGSRSSSCLEGSALFGDTKSIGACFGTYDPKTSIPFHVEGGADGCVYGVMRVPRG